MRTSSYTGSGVHPTYAARRAKRREQQRALYQKKQEETFHKSILEKESLMRAFEEAFFAVSGKNIKVVFGKDEKFHTRFTSYTEQQLIMLTRTMHARVHEQELNNPED